MGKLKSLLISQIFSVGLVTVACAQSQIWTSQGELSSFETLENDLKTHSVIILGENHELKTHQGQQLEILQSLRKWGRSVNVGMEFFSYIYQDQVEAYRKGVLSEADFLKQIFWGSMSFDLYRPQVLFPNSLLGEQTWALNAPRELTGSISKTGLAGLTPELKQLLPPDFTLGRSSYRDRFQKVMEDHIKDPQKFQNYFEAQSTWDDTMAWRIQNFVSQNPGSVLVVIVGEFHVQFGGGLPDRLKARGIDDVLVISQVNTEGLTEDEIQKQVQPSAEYGPRADWIWTAPAVE